MSDPLDISDFECPICSSLLYKPLAIPCGHAFCEECLRRSLDHTSACPLCREVCYLPPEAKPNLLLTALIRKLYPQEYEERAAEEAEEQHLTQLPIFFLGHVCFPHESFSLHIFEQRYR